MVHRSANYRGAISGPDLGVNDDQEEMKLAFEVTVERRRLRFKGEPWKEAALVVRGV